ncbi:MAG: ATP-grasp domain-containing protein [Planctomycetaceae bacterium]
MNPNILLLSAGRRVELLQGIQNAASAVAPASKVFCADMRPDFSAACQLADRAFEIPAIASSGYAAALGELCQRERIGLVIPTIDTELAALARLQSEFLKRGTMLVVSDSELISQCRDKRKTAILFERLGIPTPAIFDPSTIRFPCFTKFFDGSNSVGAMRLESGEQLTDAMKAEPNRIYMELVPPTHCEVTVDMYYDKTSTLKALVPRQRIEVRGGEVSKGVTRRDWVYDYLLQRLSLLPGARGCLTLQVFVGDRVGEVLGIEINPRFGGGYPLSLAAGADFPSWLIREYLLGESLSFFDEWESDLLMLRYDAKVLVHAGS